MSHARIKNICVATEGEGPFGTSPKRTFNIMQRRRDVAIVTAIVIGLVVGRFIKRATFGLLVGIFVGLVVAMLIANRNNK